MANNPTHVTRSNSSAFHGVELATVKTLALEADDDREGLLIYNDSDSKLLVSFTGDVSSSEYSFKILPGGYYESGATIWLGDVYFLWEEAGSGQALITELGV